LLLTSKNNTFYYWNRKEKIIKEKSEIKVLVMIRFLAEENDTRTFAQLFIEEKVNHVPEELPNSL
jgi:hypothetical protein